ncbi:MAG: P13 family porin [Sphaerochaetaceae bacterium]
MKKIIIVTLVMLMTFSVFASDGLSSLIELGLGIAESASDSKKLSDSSEKKTIIQIESLIKELPPDADKQAFYEENKVKGTGPAFGNLLLGFGIGSSWQHNTISAMTQSTVESLGLGLGLGCGLGLWVCDVIFVKMFTGNTIATEDDPLLQMAIACAGAGVAVSLVSRTIGFISAFTYAGRYNKNLKNNLELAFVPNPLDDSFTFMAKVSLD